jgi:hypothetical protein
MPASSHCRFWLTASARMEGGELMRIILQAAH